MRISHITNEDASGLNIGDPVIITGNVQFKGKTGDIVDFGKDNRFVVVNLYNYGKHSFHASDVSYNDYADSDAEEADAYDRDSDARNWMHNQDVGESKTGTKFVGKWKGTDSAEKAKKRLVGEAKSLQSKFEKHLARHGYDVGEKSKYWEKKLKDIDAQIAAWDAEMAARKQSKETTNEDGGGYYYEILAKKVFDERPNFSTKGRADELVDYAYRFAVQDLGKNRARYEFGYDEDFLSDFVSAYGWLQDQHQGVAEGKFGLPEVGDMIQHVNGATGKIRKLSWMDGDTYIYFKDKNGDTNYGRWGKEVTALKGKGVAEGEYDPSYDPDYRPYQKPERNPDWDREEELGKPAEKEVAKTVTVRDNDGNVVLQFPSTGGFYGDLRYAASKGIDTDSGDYHMDWKTDANEDSCMNEETGATSEQVASEIVRRIIFKHKDAITAFGPEAIMAAAREVGEYFAGAEELGTSDIGIATKYALDKLERQSTGNLEETASGGCTSAGAIATTPTGGAGKNVGSLFGGSYKQKRTKKSPGTK